MAIGERIHFVRILRGMTQKYLGTIIGFPERSADVSLAQYDTGTRKPKAESTATLAQALDVVLHRGYDSFTNTLQAENMKDVSEYETFEHLFRHIPR